MLSYRNNYSWNLQDSTRKILIPDYPVLSQTVGLRCCWRIGPYWCFYVPLELAWPSHKDPWYCQWIGPASISLWNQLDHPMETLGTVSGYGLWCYYIPLEPTLPSHGDSWSRLQLSRSDFCRTRVDVCCAHDYLCWQFNSWLFTSGSM